MSRSIRPSRRPAPDLDTQLEDLLDQVWKCEAEARLDDRIDLALHIPSRRRTAREVRS